MKLGILSDIHSNLEALEAAYEALENEGCERYVCVGDVVGYGANPQECVDFIRGREILTVRGNHDHYTICDKKPWDIQPYARKVIEWNREVMSADSLEWLKSLPFMAELEDVVFVHSSLEALDGEYWPYILDPKSALFHFFLQESKYAFFGHTHIPLFFCYDENHKISIEILKNKSLPKDSTCQYLINPGSVGQPRDFDSRGSVVVFDTELLKIEVIRVEYDIRKAQSKIIDAGLPEILAERLSRGS
jgi:predicted phosphodiesterase